MRWIYGSLMPDSCVEEWWVAVGLCDWQGMSFIEQFIRFCHDFSLRRMITPLARM